MCPFATLMKVLKINNETISKLELMVNLLYSRKLNIILAIILGSFNL